MTELEVYCMENLTLREIVLSRASPDRLWRAGGEARHWRPEHTVRASPLGAVPDAYLGVFMNAVGRNYERLGLRVLVAGGCAPPLRRHGRRGRAPL